MRSHYRTRHRSLILRTIKDQPLSVKLIQNKLSELFEAGKLKRLPSIVQIHRTIGDLRKSHFVVGNKNGRATYYSKRVQ